MNVAGRAMGPIDAPLTERGRAVAADIATRLSPSILYPYDLWTSPSRRCAETAALLFSAGLPRPRSVFVDPRLEGVDSGHLNGLDTRTIALEVGLPHDSVTSDITMWAFCGREGETWEGYASRCTSCFADLLQASAVRDVLAVSHGFPLRAFMSLIQIGRVDRVAVAAARRGRGDIMAIRVEDSGLALRIHPHDAAWGEAL